MSVRMFLLGELSRGPAHGYELRETARRWDLGAWAEVSTGSIYHGLDRLAAEGLVEPLGVEQLGRRPPRQRYRINPAGRAALLDLVRGTCRGLHNPKYPIDLGLAFLGKLPARERRAILQERLAALEALQKRVRAKRARASGPPWALAVLDHDVLLRGTEIRWTRRLLEEVGSWPAEERKQRA